MGTFLVCVYKTVYCVNKRRKCWLWTTSGCWLLGKNEGSLRVHSIEKIVHFKELVNKSVGYDPLPSKH